MGTFFRELLAEFANCMNIKELREKKKLSQQELADAVGIPRDRIGKWEQGKGNPKTDDYKKLEAFFGEFVPEKETIREVALEKDLTLRSLARTIELSAEARLLDAESRKIEAENMKRLVALLESQVSSASPATAAGAHQTTDKLTDNPEVAEDLTLDKKYTKGK